ncbi:MAG: SUMF1/EgtB/PvdO family nonheme iron enzyme [Polyangiales bacterium]
MATDSVDATSESGSGADGTNGADVTTDASSGDSSEAASDIGTAETEAATDSLTDVVADTADAAMVDSFVGDAPIADADAPDALPTISVEHCNWTSSTDMTLNGSAVVTGGDVLRLTDTTGYVKGSAYWTHGIVWDPSSSFSTFFALKMGPNIGGGDGLAFVLQSSTSGPKALGGIGGYFGYANDPGDAGIAPSIAIEFDTFQNSWDPDANHVALLMNGDVTTHLALANPSFTLASASEVFAWIEYDAATKTVVVYVNNAASKPSAPLLSYTGDAAAILSGAGAGGLVYVGFSAGTGTAVNDEDVEQWTWSVNGTALTCPQPGDAGVDASTFDTSSDSPADATSDTPAIPFGTPHASCAAPLTCGTVSCCDTQPVPGGILPFGRSASGADACPVGMTCNADEQPERSATLSAYALDTYEVTVGRFREFVNGWDYKGLVDGVGANPNVVGSGWQSAWNSSLPTNTSSFAANLKCGASYQTWTDTPGANENMAISCVSWFEAFAFCAWDGGSLPSEAEHEYAAAGGAENRLYPWGSTDPATTPSLANFGGGDHTPYENVGSHTSGVGKWGHQDLSGGMYEWALDFYDAYTASACTECVDLTSNTNRVFRGGGWGSANYKLRAAFRAYNPPTFRNFDVGVRCARSS